jgi:hypothetical protein
MSFRAMVVIRPSFLGLGPAKRHLISWRQVVRAGWLVLTGIIWALASLPAVCVAVETEATPGTNTFPTVPEVLGGQTFKSYAEQDIYFLRSIHDRYHDHWSDLLEANLTLNDFVVSPEKQLRFVNELGEAMRGRNDLPACTNLALITSDPTFYANTNVSRPEIIAAAAKALIRIGPAGRQALVSTFTQSHYRIDPASLEVLADAIGEERPDDPRLVTALAATAFDFSTTNGAFYPHCAMVAVKNVLWLTNGPAAVQAHLKIEECLNNPGRFQSIVDGIAAAQAKELSANLAAVEPEVKARLAALATSPGGYRDDLSELENRIKKALMELGRNNGTN